MCLWSVRDLTSLRFFSWGSFTFCFWCNVALWELGNSESEKNPLLFLNLSSTGRWLSAVDQLLFWWEVAVILKIHVEICITDASVFGERDVASVLSLITALTDGTLNLLCIYVLCLAGIRQCLTSHVVAQKSEKKSVMSKDWKDFLVSL